ncbi:MAG: LysR family transcriptional regulator [Syntrophomonadaceae bacterium]|nr:LysR family transcriptional regulator [Syntrophomonadaceae bacterium]MDD3024617.1 LysR family transcriptional regulator [Syntrophomonadaceae bacterium]
MEIKHLKTFAMIAKTGSFSHAAIALGYAQPTVSTHVLLLERELKTHLFERLGHRITLTRQGEKLLSYAENILKLSAEAIANVAAIGNDGNISGKISIGANESFSMVRLPLIMKQFMEKHPQVEISLKFGTVKGIYEQLLNNVVDIAFFLTREVRYSDLIIETLLPEPAVVVLAPDHPFNSLATANIRIFQDQNLVVTQENCTYRAMINDLLKEADIRPRSIIEINNINAIKQLVMNGMGITILPRVSVEYEVSQNLLLELPWDQTPLPVFTQIAYHKNKWLTPAILSFIEESRQCIGSKQE